MSRLLPIKGRTREKRESIEEKQTLGPGARRKERYRDCSRSTSRSGGSIEEKREHTMGPVASPGEEKHPTGGPTAAFGGKASCRRGRSRGRRGDSRSPLVSSDDGEGRKDNRKRKKKKKKKKEEKKRKGTEGRNCGTTRRLLLVPGGGYGARRKERYRDCSRSTSRSGGSIEEKREHTMGPVASPGEEKHPTDGPAAAFGGKASCRRGRSRGRRGDSRSPLVSSDDGEGRKDNRKRKKKKKKKEEKKRKGTEGRNCGTTRRLLLVPGGGYGARRKERYRDCSRSTSRSGGSMEEKREHTMGPVASPGEEKQPTDGPAVAFGGKASCRRGRSRSRRGDSRSPLPSVSSDDGQGHRWRKEKRRRKESYRGYSRSQESSRSRGSSHSGGAQGPSAPCPGYGNGGGTTGASAAYFNGWGWVLAKTPGDLHKSHGEDGASGVTSGYSTRAMLGDTGPVRRRPGQKFVDNFNPHVPINHLLNETARKKSARHVLDLWERRNAEFNGVNWSTLISRLGQDCQGAEDDPRLQDVVAQVARLLADGNIAFRARDMSSIVSGAAKLPMSVTMLDLQPLFHAVERQSERLITEGDSRCWSNTVWAFAKSGIHSPPLFEAVARQSEKLAAEGNPQELALAVWGFATLGVQSPPLFEAVARQGEKLATEGTPQNLSNTVWAFATSGVESPQLFEAVARQSERLVSWGTAQDLSITAWAFAKAGVESPRLMDAVTRHSETLATEGTPQDLSTTVWAFATSGVESPQLFEAVARQSERLVTEGTPQHVSMTVWAFAKLGVESPRLLDAVTRHSEWIATEGDAQTLTNTVWSFAALGVASPQVFDAVARQSERLATEGIPQNLANTARSFAKAGVKPPQLLDAVMRHSEWIATEGDAHSLTDMVWAFATWGVTPPPQVFKAVARQSERLLAEGTPRNVANTVWAFAKLGVESPRLFDAVARQSDSLIERAQGEVRILTQLVWSFATAGVDSPPLFAAVARQGELLAREGTAQDLAITAWALATSGFNSPELLNAVVRHTERLASEGTTQQLAMTVWAVAVLGMWQCKDELAHLWSALSRRATGEEHLEGYSLETTSCQMLLAAWASKYEAPELAWATTIPQEVLRRGRESATKGTSSDTHLRVSLRLRELGWQHENEVSVDPGILGHLMALDMACTATKVAVEFNGPSHYMTCIDNEAPGGEGAKRENGRTQFKARVLAAAGWRVVAISGDEWHHAERSRRDVDAFLRKKMAEVGVRLIGGDDEPAALKGRNGTVSKELAALALELGVFL